ncbi:MAG: transposase [Anaerolineaceae bacterium]|nr:transposase [Anaerolineaceae bacterium]
MGNLFESVNQTLQRFAVDPKWRINGQLGFIAELHTWSQTLIDHFHLHCLIPPGALSADKTRWVPARKNYLFRVASLARQFRKSYLDHLQLLYDTDQLRFCGQISPQDFSGLMKSVRKKNWIVYAKAPFGGPQSVLDYLGRYTHRVAISNHRLVSIDKGQIRFTYKDRSANNRTDPYHNRDRQRVSPAVFAACAAPALC